MSTNYYLITDELEDRGISVKVRKHIGKSTGYFIFEAQPEWFTVDECFKYLELVLDKERKESLRNGSCGKYGYHIEDEYGSYVSLDELKEVIRGATISNKEYELYSKYRGHYLDQSYLFSMGEFS